MALAKWFSRAANRIRNRTNFEGSDRLVWMIISWRIMLVLTMRVLRKFLRLFLELYLSVLGQDPFFERPSLG